MSEDCPHCLYEKTEDNCPGCWEGSHYRPKPKTNAGRIRSMTDEELAKFVANVADHGCGSCAPGHYDCTGKENCVSCWLDWLKQGVDKDGGA